MAKKKSSSKPKNRKKTRIRKGRLLLVLAGCCVLTAGLIFAGYGIYARYGSHLPALSEKDKTSPLVDTSQHSREVEAIKAGNALDKFDASGFSDQELRSCFYSQELDEKLLDRLNAMGYAGNESCIAPEDIRYVRVLYHNFDNDTIVGEMMIHKDLAQDIEDIFYDLYTHGYQINKMLLTDAYGGSSAESFADNNTVGLCFGLSADNSGQAHAYGSAVDLNPLYNPLVRDNGNSVTVFPSEGQLYLDRSINIPHLIHPDDYAITAFKKKDFIWKGDVAGLNDYKHFEKAVNSLTSAREIAAREQAQAEAEARAQEEAAAKAAQEAAQAQAEAEAQAQTEIQQPKEEAPVEMPAEQPEEALQEETMPEYTETEGEYE